MMFDWKWSGITWFFEGFRDKGKGISEGFEKEVILEMGL
jgi:hypothetical protein